MGAVSRLFAFLRAINVGGHVVTMDVLRGQFEELGFTTVETFIASGNVVFTTRVRTVDTLPKKIEARLLQVLGYEVHTFLRTESELAAVSRTRPFTTRQLESAAAFCVGFLAAPLSTPAVKEVMALRTDVDDFQVIGREVYWLCRQAQSKSTFNNNRLEKAIHGRATFRSMTTIDRLATRYLKP